MTDAKDLQEEWAGLAGHQLVAFSCINTWLRGVKTIKPDLAAPSDRISRNRQKLKHRKFHLKRRQNFFTVRLVQDWNRLPEDTGFPTTGDTQNASGQGPEPPALFDPDLSRGG